MTPNVTQTAPGSTSIGRHLVAVVSLMATPLVIFIASASTLYLNNQNEFQHQFQVLFPFVGLFCLTLAVGIAFYALSKLPLFLGFLWAYYLAGPFFLVFGFLQNWSMGAHFFLWVFDTWAGVLVYLGLFLVATVAVTSRLDPRPLLTPLAAFSLLLFMIEIHSFVNAYQPPDRSPSLARVPRLETREDLPNIYHIILDGYEGPFFPKTLSSQYRQELDGFVNFTQNVAIYPSTNMSLPSIFTGRRRDKNISNVEYMRRAFNSNESFLYWLRKAGYRTVAFAPTVYRFELGLFDHVVHHEQNPRAEYLLAANTATFKRLWFWGNSPRLLIRLLLPTEWFIEYGAENLRLVKNRNYLPFSVPIVSYASFLNILDQEAELPARGRYTLLHIVIPHQPEFLAADCSYDELGKHTSQLEQAGCATKLLVTFVQRLKELDRYDNSFIVAQGDHGAYKLNSDSPTHSAERVSLRALLLIKPIGADWDLAFSEAKTSVVDIAPTLLQGVSVENQLHAEGASLLETVLSIDHGQMQMD